MKDIYINGKFLCQKVTGVQRVAIELTKALDNINDPELKFYILAPSNIINKLELNNIDIIEVPGNAGYSWEQLKLPKYCKKHKVVDLLSFCNIAPIKFPGSCFVHDLAVIEAKEGYSWKQRFIYKYINKKNIKKYKNIFTVSNTMKNHIESYYDVKDVNVLYNGCEHLKKANEAKPELDVPEKYYLAVGSMNPNKNFASILRIAKNMPLDNFLIVGGSHKSFQEQKMEIPSNVKFVGYVSDNELTYLYSHAYAFLFPSKYEGFGIPPMEAITLGCKTVICNNIDVLHELYDGICDFEDFDKIDYLKPSYKTITESDIETLKERFSWYKSANELINILKK